MLFRYLPIASCLLFFTSFASAQSTSEARPGPHKGVMQTVDDIQVEQLIQPGGLTLFLYDRAGASIKKEGLRGVATLAIDGNAKRYRYDLMPASDGSLTANVNLSRATGRKVQIDYQLVGLNDRTIRFRHDGVIPSAKPATRLTVSIGKPAADDAAWIAKQKTCPVMGEPLGSMGAPVKLVVGPKPVFLCCRGCIKKVQAEPRKYFVAVHGEPTATVPKGTEEVREGVFKVGQADQSFIAAQKKCPVMDEPLDAMGGPYKVDAAGKAIYICCPGCAKMIAAEPQKYLTLLKEQGVNSPAIE